MYFYVDESGHTGSNLFDLTQPVLYYGVLHSPSDLDAVASESVAEMRSLFGVDRLHAAELGVGRLMELVPRLVDLISTHDLIFDFSRVVKKDHVVITFFDQVFDQGINPAVPWSAYWTPLRYVLTEKVAYLFTAEISKDAWTARNDTVEKRATILFKSVCRRLLGRVDMLPDARSREIISDTLLWALNNPHAIGYNCSTKQQKLNISPNMIGFQFVMFGMAHRINHSAAASRIIIDQQCEFNKAQKELAEAYGKMRDAGVPPQLGPGLPELDFKNIPEAELEFKAGDDSVGLELVDVFLWIVKRLISGTDFSEEFNPLLAKLFMNAEYNELSLAGISNRYSKFVEELPPLNDEIEKKCRELIEQQERQRKLMMETYKCHDKGK